MKTTILTVIAITFSLLSSAQNTWTARDSATVKKFERSIELAKVKVDKAQVKVDYADSLIQIGTEQLNEAKTLAKQLKAETKTLDKQHATDRKPFVKISKSKDRDEAAEAKAELKQIDTKYKADAKVLSNKTKANDKILSTGKRNLDKGKGYAGGYKSSLKEAQANLAYYKEELEYTIEDLNYVEEPKKEKKKKK